MVDGPKRGVGVWFVEEPAKQPGLRAVGLGSPMTRTVEPEPVVRGANLGTARAASPSRRTMVDLGDGLAAADAPGMRLQDRRAHPGRERAARHQNSTA